MDIYGLLSEDHARVHSLFTTMDSSGDPAERQRLLDQLKRELDLHTQLEEELFYPELLHSQRTGDRVRHALHEHGEIHREMMALSGVDADSDSWRERFQAVRARIEDHVKEEENQLFPQARQVLSTRLEDDMLSRARRRRDELHRRPGGPTTTYGWSEAARGGASSFVADQARHAADQVHELADALRRTAGTLDEQGQPLVSGYLDGAASGLDRLSSSIGSGDLETLVGRTREFARRQPALFVGGAFAVGLLMSRLLSAGGAGTAPRQPPQTRPEIPTKERH